MQKFRRSPSLSSTCFLCAVPLCWLHNFTRLLCRCRREYRVFQKLLGMVPHLGDRLVDCSNEESMVMADLVRPLQSNITSFLLLFILQIQKGVSSARSDDTKSMKGAVLDWITPRDVLLNPVMSRRTVVSTIMLQGFFSVLLEWTGVILSTFRRLPN